MAIQLAVATRNARLSALAAELGASPLLKVFTGTQPADVATADSGTQLAGVTCPASPFAAPASGAMALSGTWQDLSADNSGTPGYFRMYTSGGVCKLQGSISLAAGGGDMEVNSTTWTAGGSYTVTSFTLTDANS